MKYFALIAAFGLFFLTLSSCREVGEGESDKTPQGVITYAIDYPDSKESYLYPVLPKEMSLVYKGDLYKTVVSVRGMFQTTLITDNKNHKLTAIYKNGTQEWYSEMTKEEVDQFLAEFPDVTYIESQQVDTLFGVECSYKTAIFSDISKEVKVAYTNDIPISDPNWCNPYRDIDGMLINYEIRYYGVHMDFDAKAINQDTTLSADEFKIPSGYQQVPYKQIKDKLLEMFNLLNES